MAREESSVFWLSGAATAGRRDPSICLQGRPPLTEPSPPSMALAFLACVCVHAA